MKKNILVISFLFLIVFCYSAYSGYKNTNWTTPRPKTVITESDTYWIKSILFMNNGYFGGDNGKNGWITLNQDTITNWADLYQSVIVETGFKSNVDQQITTLSNTIYEVDSKIIRRVTVDGSCTNVEYLFW